MDIPLPSETALQPSHDTTNLSEAIQILERLRNGSTVEEAARALGLSRSTAFRRLALIEEDVDRGVVKLLTAKGLDFAEDWIAASKIASAKGDHRPAKDALLHAKQIEPLQDNQAGARIAIIIGTPEQPIRVEPPQVVETTGVSE